MTNLPPDYDARVYAGILGKLIGVYLGRPFEGWGRRQIEETIGEVNYYVHQKFGVPLVVTDDDISGTFIFPRAFDDNNCPYDVTPKMVADVWLNHLIENKTVLWWGGLGVSTEHTAFLRLRDGIQPPDSGSIERNTQVVAEQIGAQIFIDAWAMIAPGDPEKAARLAGVAASVSHDGDAVRAAQLLAAMEAIAFVESDRDKILDLALVHISKRGKLRRLVDDIRAWHSADPSDWRHTFAQIENKYGYDKFGGGCHVIPNHAIIQMAFLHGDDDFQRTLMIAATAGWDTDCNVGNIGALMGIKNGLDAIDRGPDYRTPVADRMYLPSAKPGSQITDAAVEAVRIANIGRRIQGMRPVMPNGGMRYHFMLPGSLHGFRVRSGDDATDGVSIDNVEIGELAENAGVAADERALVISYRNIATGVVARVATDTFYPAEAYVGGYEAIGSPNLYSGQLVRARVVAGTSNARAASVRLCVGVLEGDGNLTWLCSHVTSIAQGEASTMQWTVPDTHGRPVGAVGLQVVGQSGTGSIYLDWLDHSGVPSVSLCPPTDGPLNKAWRASWITDLDRLEFSGPEALYPYRLVSNRGSKLAISGGHVWTGYRTTAHFVPHMAESFALLAAVRGLRRHVALEVTSTGNAKLVYRKDDIVEVIAEETVSWAPDTVYALSLDLNADGNVIGIVDAPGALIRVEGLIPMDDASGGVGMSVDNGVTKVSSVRVEPLTN